MNKHECVGAAQLAEKDATIAALHEQVAEYAAFQTEVMDIHTLRFKGEVRAPVDAEDLLSRIRLDHVLACTARSAAAKDGHGPMYNAVMSRAERTDRAVSWLKNLNQRLAFRECRAPRQHPHGLMSDRDVHEPLAVIRELRTSLYDAQAFKGCVMESVRLSMTPSQSMVLTDGQAVELIREKLRGSRMPSTIKHPSSKPSVDERDARALYRIEGLAKQAAERSSAPAFWCGAVVTALISALCYAVWS